MSKRLQVLLQPKEYKTFRQLAKETGLSLGEWVRQALRLQASGVSSKNLVHKIKNVRKASQYSFPSGEIDRMLSEIEKGYLS